MYVDVVFHIDVDVTKELGNERSVSVTGIVDDPCQSAQRNAKRKDQGQEDWQTADHKG